MPFRWIVWGVPAALFFLAFLNRVAPGVLAKDLMQAFHVTGTLVGLLSATYFYSYAGFMIPAGVLVDRFGVRRVVTAGGAVMALGTIAMGAAGSVPVLFAGRFVIGLGATVTFVGTLKVAADWFPPSRFGTLSALTATVGVLGALGATAPLAALVGVAGWRGAFTVLGLVTLALGALCLLAVRDRPAGAGPAPAAPRLRQVLAGTRVVLANPHTWPPFLAFFCMYAAMGDLQLWVVPYLRDVHALSTSGAALYATANSLALLVAAPLTGFLSDRVVRRRKLPYAALTSAQLVLWATLVATLGALPLPGFYALLFAMGLVGGAFVLTWPIGREVNPPALAGVSVAVVNFGGFLGAALTQPLLAAI
ncbi:MAG: MFS transporter, partial [Candidatus Rokubacteria bacterium]|nr:MFS transporter [Candidatus Rokubacteria bacterium]